MSRPRIRHETEEILDRVDTRLARIDRSKDYSLPEEANKVLARRSEGRGSGSNYFTRDSVLRLALKTLDDDLLNAEASQ